MKVWIENILQISSSYEEVEIFVNQNKNKTCLDFSKSVPTKSKKNFTQYKIEISKEWGCHSNCCQPNITYRNPNNIIYKFKTDRHAPIIWLIKVSIKYPTITFILNSNNKRYQGYITMKNGEIINYKDLD